MFELPDPWRPDSRTVCSGIAKEQRMRKPDSILYGRDDKPPPGMLGALAAQHVLVLSIFLVSPVAVVRAAELPLGRAGDLISLSMIGMAFASILQIRPRGPFGSGLLAIPATNSVFVPGCIIAARLGGLPMMAGLLALSALFEIALSRFLRHLRGILPAELSGLIVLVTGLSIAQTGMDNVVGSMAAGEGAGWLAPLLVTVVTLGVMVGCSVWGRGPIRTMGAIVGLVSGYVCGMASGLVDSSVLDLISHAPLVRLPTFRPMMPIFEVQLILPSLLTGLAVTLNSTGALTAAQQLSDADWKRQDLNGLSRGLLADGVGTLVCALIGGAGISASGSIVGLTANARATSVVIGYAVAAGLLVLALVPKFALLILAVPRPVLGAALIYLSCSLLTSGISIMSSRLLDTRKTFTLGIAFAVAVGTPALIRAGAILPEWMAPVVASPLLAAALVAILLNPILRLGIRQQVELRIPAGGVPGEEVSRFIARAGAAWGARREVIDRAQGPIAECLDTLAAEGLSRGETLLTLGFNELALDARISWRGQALTLSATRPTKQEMLTDDDAPARMAGYLVSRLASQVRSRSSGDMSELHLIFDH
jgi:xanthine permease XanP